jgi:hypothetical protein
MTHIKTLKLAHECTRSHPHENMDALCELRTEIARLTNENARLKAEQAQPVGVVCIEHFRGCKSMENVDFQLMTDLPPGNHPLYTAPPPRQPWVGLTDQEIIDVCDSTGWIIASGVAVDIARAIETKLKEKNNG